MTNHTAIRTGFLINAALFLALCVVADLMPGHMGPAGFFGLAAIGVAAGSYALQDMSEQATDLVRQLSKDGEDERAAALARSSATLFTGGAALAIVSWALALITFCILAVSAL